SRSEPPLRWSTHRHPEGALYFVHEQRVFTDAYLFDGAILAQVTRALTQLLARQRVQNILDTKPGRIDIVLDLKDETPENDECGYYMVDHSERIIFWVDVFDMSRFEIWDLVPGIETPSHVKTGLEMEYWSVDCNIVSSFTQKGGICSDIVCCPDAMTSSTTTLSYPVEHLFQRLTLTTEMLSQLSSTAGETTEAEMNHGSVVVLARERFCHFHGEKTPRLNNNESVYGYEPKRSYIIIILSPLLFNAPLHHLRSIEVVNMDQIINYSSWNKLITALRSEWQELVLYGTLILNTNVAFLSVPATGGSGAGQVASYTSICFGLGSIILGIVLLRKHRAESQNVPDIDTAVSSHGWTPHGLETLSIVYSLPYALMIWGMITFILAFLIIVFEKTNSPGRGIMSMAIFTVCIAMLGFVWTEKRFSWEKNITESWERVKSVGARLQYTGRLKSADEDISLTGSWWERMKSVGARVWDICRSKAANEDIPLAETV
ncbi:hypothetical protein B0H14DRAFT_2370890, partial [Mycena olivaceomarginata]